MSEHDTGALQQLGDSFLQHAEKPRNLGILEEPDGSSRLVGQCGDAIRVDLQVVDGRIEGIRVLPEGCVFTRACGSALSTLALHKTLDQALTIEPDDVKNVLGDLPEDHIHCARLAVNTLGEAVAEVLRKQAAA